ncbi:MAG: hypothetical protein IPO92_22045 [Saprospiraceae bacterium]|nr:hypothetical protein [Saprospiraceae bacterium]
MRSNIFAILLILFSFTAFSQMNPFPNGVYLSLDQLRNQKPAFDVDLKKTMRSSGDKFLIGGNDIKFESEIDSLDEKYIKKKVFAYVKKDTIYMNGLPHKMGVWFGQAVTSGNFIVFSGSGSSVLFGAIGAGLAATSSDFHVLSLRSGNVRKLSKEYVRDRLKDQAELLVKFNEEEDQNSAATLLFYINELNKITSPRPTDIKKK